MTDPSHTPVASIYDCARWYSTTLAQDVHAFFKDVDGLMGVRGLSPLRGNKVAMSGSTSLEHFEHWFRTDFGRAYANLSDDSAKKLKRIYFVEVSLCPEFAKEACVLAVRADLAKPRTAIEAWQDWSPSWFSIALGEIPDFTSEVAIPAEAVAAEFPVFAGGAFFARVQPLTSMKDEAAIKHLLVDPITKGST